MVDLGMSTYYVVDERALLLCGLNMTSRDDWTRMSWTTVWTTWVALAVICVYSLATTIIFVWRRSLIKSMASEEASPM